MAYETFNEYLDATRSKRPRPKMVDAWLAGRDSVREYYAPILLESLVDLQTRAEAAEAALSAAIVRAEIANDGWAVMIKEKEYFRQRWEVAETTLAATRAELDRCLTLAVEERRDAAALQTPRWIEGTLPADDLRRAFADGAAWWNFNSTGFTMFGSERRDAEAEAETRYPNGKPRPVEVQP